MTDLALSILTELKNQSADGDSILQYNYSTDLSVKNDEIRAIMELEEHDCILVKARTLGYVVYELL